MTRSRTFRASYLLGAALLVGCGGRQSLDDPGAGAAGAGSGGGSGASATIGPVDLNAAPLELATTCDHDVGTIAFVNPCLVGFNLAGPEGTPGFNETECRLTNGAQPVAWSFILPLSKVAQEPDRPLTFPTDLPSSPTGGMTVDVGVRKAALTSVTGTMTFSRVDPTGRAFIGFFQGTMTWTSSTGTFSCTADGPLWGGPGSFL